MATHRAVDAKFGMGSWCAGCKTRHGFHRASFGVYRRDSACAGSSRSATAARRFAAFSAGYSRFLAREFVRCSFLVRCSSALGRDCPLRLRIHCGEPARSFPTHSFTAARSLASPATTRGHTASDDTAAASSTLSEAVAVHAPTDSASLVHDVAPVVGLVCHCSISCRDKFRLVASRLLRGTVKAVYVG